MAKKKDTRADIVTGDIDIDKIESVIKTEIKDDLYNEITEKIDTESKKSLDRLEKRIIKYKNFSIFKRDLLIIIFFIIISVETYMIIANNYSIKKIDDTDKNIVEVNKNQDDKTDIDTEEVKDKNWYINNYSYLMNNIKTDLKDNKFYLYTGEHSVDDMDNSVKLNMSYQILDKNKINSNDGVIKVSSSDIKDAYKRIFGTLDSFSNGNFSNDCINFIYNATLDTYMAIDTSCEANDNKILEQIENIYEENDNIVIETLVGVLNKQDKTLNTIDGNNVINNYNDQDLSEYMDKLDKRTYIFEKREDNYYLKKVRGNN